MKAVIAFPPHTHFRYADVIGALVDLMPIAFLVLPPHGAFASVCRKWAFANMVPIITVPSFVDIYPEGHVFMQTRAMCRVARAVAPGFDTYMHGTDEKPEQMEIVAIVSANAHTFQKKCAENYYFKHIEYGVKNAVPEVESPELDAVHAS